MAFPVVSNFSSQPLRTVTTAATIEIDVMPFLSRESKGGPFTGYISTLQNLDASFVRFAPWFGYPRVSVAELTRANCTGRGSSWNTTLLDEVVADFMHKCLWRRCCTWKVQGGPRGGTSALNHAGMVVRV